MEPTSPPVPEVSVFPASFAQQRLWFLDRLMTSSEVYNILRVLRLKGPLDVPKLERCINELVRRHEILRTRFVEQDGQPEQVILPELELRLPVIELKDPAVIDEHVRQEAASPFDLQQAPLLRAKLLHLADDDHVLLLNLHHIIADGWSMGVLAREISALYNAAVAGSQAALPDLPVQYADYAVWQRDWLQGEALERQLAYWRTQLAGLHALELPLDRPRPATPSYRGGQQPFVLSPIVTDKLKALGRAEGVTLFMILLTTLQVLLHRYSGQNDFAVGTPIAGRTRPELDGLIGLFVNTLVLRSDLSGNPSFRSALRRTREVALGAYGHQELPFEKLVEELQPERDLSRNPLFQVMLTLHNTPPAEFELAGLAATRVPCDTGTAKFDLSLSLRESAGELEGVWEFAADLFEAATIGRLAGHFHTLLEGILDNPDARLSELPLLTEAERSQVLREWNVTDRPYPSDRCIQQLFEAQVARTPRSTALVFEDRSLSYGELNTRANRLAHHLRALGVGPEVVVGLCVDRSPELVVAMLGILKAGGAYLPTDPSYPQERLAFMLEDSAAPVVVTQSALAANFKDYTGVLVCLDRDADRIAGQSPDDPQSGAAAENLAYVIYTSGSTGKPKGVQIGHRAVVNFLHAMRDRPGLTDRDVVLAITTMTFDIAVFEIHLPLITGATVVMVPRDVARDATRLAAAMDRSGATVMQATPATWRMLLNAGWQGRPNLTMLSGGEAMPRELADQLLSRGRELWNLYGPTETTVYSAGCRVTAGTSPVPIGEVIANTQIYLLESGTDRDAGTLHPVPVGIPGELYIGGDGLARGYLNRPELTAERFVEVPSVCLGRADGQPVRLYRTGDRARWRPDGNLEFLGRLDHQVKLRGYRIELGEIEAVLAEHPSVREAVVAVRDETSTDRRLVCYVVQNAGEPLSAEELRGYLKAKLPDYMVPARFVLLEHLPLTPSGKVDRKALPAPEAMPQETRTEAFPRTPTEVRLAQIWAEVLKLDAPGIHDNFFDLGGHSLLAIQLLARIDKAFDSHLPLATLFHSPTIAGLAQVLSGQEPIVCWYSLIPLRSAGQRPPLFWIQHEGEKLAHNMGADQPVYALRYGVGSPPGTELTIPQMADLAAHYIQELRSVQPEGPYFLVGYSWGGLVAYEVAQQLRASGCSVGLVALLDTFLPGTFHPLQVWRRRLAYFLSLNPVEFAREFTKGLNKRLRAGRTGRHYRLDEFDAEAIYPVIRRYRPAAYSGKVILFKALESRSAPRAEWVRLVGPDLEIREIPGNHYTFLLDHNGAQIASRIRDAMDEAVHR